jgi:hypothetical protein
MKKLFEQLIIKDVDFIKDQGINFPDIIVEQGHISEFPKKRDFAMSIYNGKYEPVVLRYSPRLLEQDFGTIIGILRHEFGHIWFFGHGNVKTHTEVQADKKAEELFGTPIFYNKDYIQTIYPTKYSIRPHHLPK